MSEAQKPTTSASDNYARKKAERQAKKKRNRNIALGVAAVIVVAAVAIGAVMAQGSRETTDPALEARIAELEEQNEKLRKENEDLNALMEQMSSDIEHIEEPTAGVSGETMQAYEDLVKALNAMLTYDEETLNEALKALEGKVELLSSEAMDAYYMVMEYMEQPYWGKQ